MRAFEFSQGSLPLLIIVPHIGTQLTPDVSAALIPQARALPDTDWHQDKLWQFARAAGASILMANYSRMVIDVDCPPPGNHQNSDLWPQTLQDGTPSFTPGKAPTIKDREQVFEQIWKPWHQQVNSELQRLKRQYGYAQLLDIQALSSRLVTNNADINILTGNAERCPAAVLEAITRGLDKYKQLRYAVDGPFREGYALRAVARPEEGICALQVIIAQNLYMDEHPPYRWLPAKAQQLQPVLTQLITGYLNGVREWAASPISR
ncbi:N-formylglutamate amidohydrolase [Shimwellia pseudoproteus]|uniref:N-formylglutamate amidohydrolase n=1 Tax=Shimwellia pseudoproteus TaxID=570012 RepID=UPI0018ECB730|nr:N-formylglutamate amidohydrolase [Shimwellia pseudoproteus]MBJ3813958.1 N-formylglutamate amidohydrolase [Shimwellia pseudoproteus]